MIFQIEKQTKWSARDKETLTNYYVWADSECLSCCNTEEEAKEVYETAKKKYIHKKSEIILEETID